jgi:hypothetical protein
VDQSKRGSRRISFEAWVLRRYPGFEGQIFEAVNHRVRVLTMSKIMAATERTTRERIKTSIEAPIIKTRKLEAERGSQLRGDKRTAESGLKPNRWPREHSLHDCALQEGLAEVFKTGLVPQRMPKASRTNRRNAEFVHSLGCNLEDNRLEISLTSTCLYRSVLDEDQESGDIDDTNWKMYRYSSLRRLAGFGGPANRSIEVHISCPTFAAFLLILNFLTI